MRLIDADALKDLYGVWADDHTEFLKPEIDRYIDRQPTIEAEPVKHGRWEVRGQDVFCTNCEEESGYNAWGASSFSDYCPNCGAKMDVTDINVGNKTEARR